MNIKQKEDYLKDTNQVISKKNKRRQELMEQVALKVKTVDPTIQNLYKGVSNRSTDLTGWMNPEGHLLVLGDSGKRTPKGLIIWRCVCGCGREIETNTMDLKKRKTCGKCKKIERTRINKSKYSYLLLNHTKRGIDSLTSSEQYTILNSFLAGVPAVELEHTWNLRTGSVRVYLKNISDSLAVGLNIESKMNEINYSSKAPKELDVDSMVQSVLDRNYSKAIDNFVSPIDSADLTPEEVSFSWLLVQTGSIITALRGSGFLEAIGEDKGTAYLQVLGTYLTRKRNIATFIKTLKSNQEIVKEISKDIIQNELVTQIYQLKEKISYETESKSSDRGYLLKAIEMLGKTCGAFADRLTIEQVDPSAALDKLIEVAKEESKKSSYKILEETLVVDEEEYDKENSNSM